MSASWLRPLFVTPLLERISCLATQESLPFAGEVSILLQKQDLSRKHAFVAEVSIKERLLWLSDGFVTVTAVVTEEAVQHLEQDSEYVSVAQLRLGEIILRKFDLVLERLQSIWKPRLIIHQFYYKGEIFAPLENSLELERDPKVGHLLDTFSKILYGQDNYRKEAVFVLSGLWKQAFHLPRKRTRFATSRDMLRLSKFVEIHSVQLSDKVENNVHFCNTFCNEVEHTTEPISTTEMKQEYTEQRNTDEMVMVTEANNQNITSTSSQRTIQSCISPESSSITLEETKATQREHFANGSSPSGEVFCASCWKRRKLEQSLSTWQTEVDIIPMNDILSNQSHPQRLQIVQGLSVHIRDTTEHDQLVQCDMKVDEMKDEKKIYSIEELLQEREKWRRCSSIYSLITPKKRKETG